LRIDENPLFRKTIVAWYDAELTCLITVFLMELVFLFGAAGLSVVHEAPPFRRYIWLPSVLMGLSFAVVISITIRLIHRYTRGRKKRRSGVPGFISIKRR